MRQRAFEFCRREGVCLLVIEFEPSRHAGTKSVFIEDEEKILSVVTAVMTTSWNGGTHGEHSIGYYRATLFSPPDWVAAHWWNHGGRRIILHLACTDRSVYMNGQEMFDQNGSVRKTLEALCATQGLVSPSY